jgi:hypothetical protein
MAAVAMVTKVQNILNSLKTSICTVMFLVTSTSSIDGRKKERKKAE